MVYFFMDYFYSINFLHYVRNSASFVSGTWISWSTAISRPRLCARVCVLSGCFIYYGHAYKRSCVDCPWSSKPFVQYWSWVVGQTLVALRWTWRVYVVLGPFWGWSPLRSLLWKGLIWEGLLDACAALDVQLLTETGPLLFVFRCPFSLQYFANISTIGRVAANLSFVCVVMRAGYLLVCITSNFCHPAVAYAEAPHQISGLATSVEGVSLALCSDGFGRCISLRLPFKTITSSGLR